MIIAGSRRFTNRSSRPADKGKLLWYALGAKTIELIHETFTRGLARRPRYTGHGCGSVSRDTRLQDPGKSKELEVKIIARLRKHQDHPRFVDWGGGLKN